VGTNSDLIGCRVVRRDRIGSGSDRGIVRAVGPTEGYLALLVELEDHELVSWDVDAPAYQVYVEGPDRD
jgi:hypothetical protein